MICLDFEVLDFLRKVEELFAMKYREWTPGKREE